MNTTDKNFKRGLDRKLQGGAPLEVFVSDGIWLGGSHESRSHQPFVAVGPENWDDEEELTFFKNASEVESFIDKPRAASDAAFSSDGDTSLY